MLLLVLMNQFTPVRGETGGERFGCNMVESVGLRWVFSFLFLWSYLPADPPFQLFYQGKEGVFLVFGFFFYLGWDGKSVFVFFSSCFYACMHGVFIDILPLSSSCSYSPFFCPFPFPLHSRNVFYPFFPTFPHSPTHPCSYHLIPIAIVITKLASTSFPSHISPVKPHSRGHKIMRFTGFPPHFCSFSRIWFCLLPSETRRPLRFLAYFILCFTLLLCF